MQNAKSKISRKYYAMFSASILGTLTRARIYKVPGGDQVDGSSPAPVVNEELHEVLAAPRAGIPLAHRCRRALQGMRV
eukprot:7745503-Pyramimonas_sp.AAC.1